MENTAFLEMPKGLVMYTASNVSCANILPSDHPDNTSSQTAAPFLMASPDTPDETVVAWSLTRDVTLLNMLNPAVTERIARRLGADDIVVFDEELVGDGEPVLKVGTLEDYASFEGLYRAAKSFRYPDDGKVVRANVDGFLVNCKDEDDDAFETAVLFNPKYVVAPTCSQQHGGSASGCAIVPRATQLGGYSVRKLASGHKLHRGMPIPCNSIQDWTDTANEHANDPQWFSTLEVAKMYGTDTTHVWETTRDLTLIDLLHTDNIARLVVDLRDRLQDAKARADPREDKIRVHLMSLMMATGFGFKWEQQGERFDDRRVKESVGPENFGTHVADSVNPINTLHRVSDMECDKWMCDAIKYVAPFVDGYYGEESYCVPQGTFHEEIAIFNPKYCTRVDCATNPDEAQRAQCMQRGGAGETPFEVKYTDDEIFAYIDSALGNVRLQTHTVDIDDSEYDLEGGRSASYVQWLPNALLLGVTMVCSTLPSL